MIDNIKKELLKLKDKKYKEFSSKLLPNIDNVLGVRLPFLRKKAKEISKNNFYEFISKNDDKYMELTMLEGMAVGYFECSYKEKIKLIKNFIKKINNWSVCDSFCSTLKFINKNKEEFKSFIKSYFKSKKEYDLRFCFVILLMYYIEDDFDYVINKIVEFDNDFYYAKMAAAWALSICIIKNYDKSIEILKTKNFQTFTYKKGITKAIESYRLNQKQKDKLRKLRSLESLK